jgi:predicted lipoprotein
MVFFILLSVSSICIFQSFSPENKNNLIEESYGVIQTFPMQIDYAHFISPLNQDNQVKVLLKSLTTNDTTGLNNKTINAVMKIYSINGTLLKTSSYPQGFNYNST